MPKPFPQIALEMDRRGEDFNPAIRLFGRRFFADQTVPELLIEFLLIAASAKSVGSNNIAPGRALPELDLLRRWMSEYLFYEPKVRLNLKLFSFLGASKLETRHETHKQHYRELISSLSSPDRISLSSSMDTNDVLRTLENLFLGFQSVGGQRTWCAQAFLPLSRNLISAETLWNETEAKRDHVESWEEITEDGAFTKYFSFNRHRFLARGGELLYLQLCNAFRQDRASARQWLESAGIGTSPTESDLDNLHASLETALSRVLDSCPDAIDKLANFLDSGIEAKTAQTTDLVEDTNQGRRAKCGWCPEESWQEGLLFAIEITRLCQAAIDPIERTELLEIACALQLLRSLCAQGSRFGPSQQRSRIGAGPLHYVWVLSDPEGRNGVNKQLSRRNLNAIQRMIYAALRHPDVRHGVTDSDYNEPDRRYGHKLFLTVGKRIGLIVPKRGSGARFVLNEKLLRCMALATIRPGGRVTYDTFKRQLFAHYGLAIDSEAVARSSSWTGTPQLSALPDRTDAWFLEMLDASGMLIRLSDSFSLVMNPFGPEERA